MSVKTFSNISPNPQKSYLKFLNPRTAFENPPTEELQVIWFSLIGPIDDGAGDRGDDGELPRAFHVPSEQWGRLFHFFLM